MAYSITAVKESQREQIHRFYEELCRRLEGEDYGPGWHYGIYPADEDLDVHIRAGEMFCARAEERLAAAMVIVGRDDPIYRDVAWEIREEIGYLNITHFRGESFQSDVKQAVRESSG